MAAHSQQDLLCLELNPKGHLRAGEIVFSSEPTSLLEIVVLSVPVLAAGLCTTLNPKVQGYVTEYASCVGAGSLYHQDCSSTIWMAWMAEMGRAKTTPGALPSLKYLHPMLIPPYHGSSLLGFVV